MSFMGIKNKEYKCIQCERPATYYTTDCNFLSCITCSTKVHVCSIYPYCLFPQQASEKKKKEEEHQRKSLF